MAYQDDLEKEIQDESKPEFTLHFAKKIVDKHKLISIHEYGRIYKYDESGIYKCISSPKVTGAIENLIISTKPGHKLTVNKRKNVIHNIYTLSYKPIEETQHYGLICFKNGILNIFTKHFIPHTSDIIFLNLVPYNYDPKEISDEWDNYLKVVLNNDLNKYKPLQEFCGYCFLNTCKFEKALFLEGGGGAGKSTFTETFQHVIGYNNFSSTSISNLIDPVLRCSIRDKYVNFDTDLPENASKYEEIFKKLSSGESIKFNEKFLPAIDESVRCKLIFNVNDFPYINDSTSAFYRRMILIKFEQKFTDDTADFNLKERLREPKNLSGIFNWCMEGLDRLIQNNKFSKNISMDNYIFELRKENNPILQFIEDCIKIDQNVCVPKFQVWEQYKQWSKDNGHKNIFSHKKFNKKLFEELRHSKVISCQKTDGDREKGWQGIDVLGIQEAKKWYPESEPKEVQWEE